MSDSTFASTDQSVPVEQGKIFVGGIGWGTLEPQLKEYFERYGEVSDCIVMRKPPDPMQPNQPVDSQRHRGFGFVTFKEPSTIERILGEKSHILDGKMIEPKRATMKSATNQQATTSLGPAKKIFVGGVAHGTTDEEVKDYFSQYGAVTEVDLKYDKSTQRMRGFGFVGFDDEGSVEKVVQMHFHQIKGKTVEAKKAEPRYSTGVPKHQFPHMTGVGGGYQTPTYGGGTDYSRGATNGQYSQAYGYGGAAANAAYQYNYPQQGSMHSSNTGGYSGYHGFPSSQFGTAAYSNYEHGASFPRTQGATGAESRDSSYANYGFNTAGQMTSYPQEGTGGYPSSRSSYGTGVDSYGQQSAAYSTGEYSRGASSQRQQQYNSRPFGH